MNKSTRANASTFSKSPLAAGFALPIVLVMVVGLFAYLQFQRLSEMDAYLTDMEKMSSGLAETTAAFYRLEKAGAALDVRPEKNARERFEAAMPRFHHLFERVKDYKMQGRSGKFLERIDHAERITREWTEMRMEGMAIRKELTNRVTWFHHRQQQISALLGNVLSGQDMGGRSALFAWAWSLDSALLDSVLWSQKAVHGVTPGPDDKTASAIETRFEELRANAPLPDQWPEGRSQAAPFLEHLVEGLEVLDHITHLAREASERSQIADKMAAQAASALEKLGQTAKSQMEALRTKRREMTRIAQRMIVMATLLALIMGIVVAFFLSRRVNLVISKTTSALASGSAPADAAPSADSSVAPPDQFAAGTDRAADALEGIAQSLDKVVNLLKQRR